MTSQSNFIAGGLQGMDPTIGTPILPNDASTNWTPSGRLQEGIPCLGDYSKLPIGWRQSAFVGQCGYKIQMSRLYSPDSPCYPIQDISCMGAAEKQAWAQTCKAIFPCKPPSYSRVGSSASTHLTTPQSTSAWKSVFSLIHDHMVLILGASLASCLFVGVTSNQSKPEENNSVSEKS